MNKVFQFALFGAFASAVPLVATGVGGIAQDFTIKDHFTQADLKLSDFEGKVLVMDFFAWWCGPCKTSSPVLVEDVEKYFEGNGGNEHGVPVEVLGMNIESSLPQNTQEFVDTAGMAKVADDTSFTAFNQFTVNFAIPLFVVINCVEGSTSHDQWEVLHVSEGFPGAETIRSVVNTVKGAPVTAGASTFSPAATELGGGWHSQSWFGNYFVQDSHWIYHESLGWSYVHATSSGAGWLYLGGEAGWCWTSDSAYPFMYSQSGAPTWLYYQQGSSSPRYFYDFSSSSWGTR